MSKQKSKRWKRSGRIIRHHIKNRCKGGGNSIHNLLQFDSEREKAWHFLFKNMSFTEVAELLLRTVRAKNAQT